MKYKLDNRKLNKKLKRPQQKYLILLPNDRVIIDTEFQAMKTWRKKYSDKPIVEMLKTDSRANSQVNTLTKLLESLEVER